jgi:hypothetical protein
MILTEIAVAHETSTHCYPTSLICFVQFGLLLKLMTCLNTKRLLLKPIIVNNIPGSTFMGVSETDVRYICNVLISKS